MRFEYGCETEECDGEMEGSFGDPVQCPVCGVWWDTEWDYLDYDSMASWITGPSEDQEQEEP